MKPMTNSTRNHSHNFFRSFDVFLQIFALRFDPSLHLIDRVFPNNRLRAIGQRIRQVDGSCDSNRAINPNSNYGEDKYFFHSEGLKNFHAGILA